MMHVKNSSINKPDNSSILTDPVNEQAGIYLLTGNEALSRAALVSGVGFFASYPGAPITTLAEVMIRAGKKYNWLHAEYSINETSAVFGATGASWTGKRSLVSMKHVGLHTCSDPVSYLGYTGVNGGLVLAVGIDPGASCSTGEFDIRHFNDSFNWVMLEPADVAEVYEYTLRGFTLSEKYKLPVMMIMTAELCNQYGTLQSGEIMTPENDYHFVKNEKYINNGLSAVKHHADLLASVESLIPESESFMSVEKTPEQQRVIITSGTNYLNIREALSIINEPVSVIKLGMLHPLPVKRLAEILPLYKEIYLFEEGEDYIYKHLLPAHENLQCLKIRRISGKRYGIHTMEEITELLSATLTLKNIPIQDNYTPAMDIPDRPGTFCPGCPHRGILYTLKKICGNNDIYGGDIGCSSLPPYYSEWLTCMGAGIGIAHGVALSVTEKRKIYASMGDSTFFHCGLPLIINSHQQNADLTLLILDNKYTAMTGHQPLPNTMGNKAMIHNILRAVGIDYIRSVDAYDLASFRNIINETKKLAKLKVIIITGECRLKFTQKLKERALLFSKTSKIIENSCHLCGECYKELGCPAILFENNSYKIDPNLCGHCGVCSQICPNHSISTIEFPEGDPDD